MFHDPFCLYHFYIHNQWWCQRENAGGASVAKMPIVSGVNQSKTLIWMVYYKVVFYIVNEPMHK